MEIPNIKSEHLSSGSNPRLCHQFVTCASDIGLKPGQWPEYLWTKLGNGRRLIQGEAEIRDGVEDDGHILVAVNYHQELGCLSIKIFND